MQSPSSKAMLCELFILLWLVLTIPVTTETAERTFSTLCWLKSFLSSSMFQPRLNHIILLHERTDELHFLEIAKNFILLNDRRLYFGNFEESIFLLHLLDFISLLPCSLLYATATMWSFQLIQCCIYQEPYY